MEKFEKQMEFLIEAEKLKNIIRQSPLPFNRKENDAEHSWSLCLYAVVLSEYAEEGTDILRCLKMLLIHDMVEIYAGDTYLYDEEANKDREQRELAAADKIFSPLGKQGEELKTLWLEFEANKSKESRFANIMDRFQPVILNYLSHGSAWQEHNVNSRQVLEMGKEKVMKGHENIKNYYLNIINDAVEKGWLKK
ncbi:MAG: HD domain-containing protein [Clostridiales bacterium]|nr:HD domain-containing protein [Clostridiales bacterium]